jgi:hypothetical protein
MTEGRRGTGRPSRRRVLARRTCVQRPQRGRWLAIVPTKSRVPGRNLPSSTAGPPAQGRGSASSAEGVAVLDGRGRLGCFGAPQHRGRSPRRQRWKQASTDPRTRVVRVRLARSIANHRTFNAASSFGTLYRAVDRPLPGRTRLPARWVDPRPWRTGVRTSACPRRTTRPPTSGPLDESPPRSARAARARGPRRAGGRRRPPRRPATLLGDRRGDRRGPAPRVRATRASARGRSLDEAPTRTRALPADSPPGRCRSASGTRVHRAVDRPLPRATPSSRAVGRPTPLANPSTPRRGSTLATGNPRRWASRIAPRLASQTPGREPPAGSSNGPPPPSTAATKTTRAWSELASPWAVVHGVACGRSAHNDGHPRVLDERLDPPLRGRWTNLRREARGRRGRAGPGAPEGVDVPLEGLRRCLVIAEGTVGAQRRGSARPEHQPAGEASTKLRRGPAPGRRFRACRPTPMVRSFPGSGAPRARRRRRFGRRSARSGSAPLRRRQRARRVAPWGRGPKTGWGRRMFGRVRASGRRFARTVRVVRAGPRWGLSRARVAPGRP